MNGKPDEHFDQRIRQSLADLRDTLPPGSSFRAERLWEQLGPQLAVPEPTSRRPLRLAWWLAAACLTGGLLGLLWYTQPTPAPVVAHRAQPAAPNARPAQIAGREPTKRVNGIAHHAAPRRPAFSAPPLARHVVSRVDGAPHPTAQAAFVPVASPPSPESTESTTALSDKVLASSPLLVTATPKRRFRVVHANELAAETEPRPAPDRTERFVRLGTDRRGQPVPDEPSPTLVLSLATKSIQ